MDLHVDLIKGGMATYGVTENAIFMPGNRDPQYAEWLAFSGVSVDTATASSITWTRSCPTSGPASTPSTT